MKKIFSLKISSKVLLYFLLISLLPLFVATFFVVSSAKSQLLDAAIKRQKIIAENTSQNVDNFLFHKISILVSQSEIFSAKDFNDPIVKQNMAVLINQDHDIDKLALLNSKGQEQTAFTRQGQSQALTNQSNSDAFKAAIFLQGKPYVSSVSYNSKNDPFITIAVPVLKSNYSQNLTNLPQASFGIFKTSEDIQGVLLARYDVSDLWQSVLSTKIGQGGYAYLVDGLGNLVAHPDRSFLEAHQNVSSTQAVNRFINGNFNTLNTVSETGLEVISTPSKLTRSNWTVIVEEPVTSVYAGVNSFIKLAGSIIICAVILSVIMSIVFRNQLLGPIKKLTAGAKKLGGGDFDHRININTNDELRDLATTFNNMGASIKRLVSNLKTNNLTLLAEQAKLNSVITSVSDGIIALNDKGQILTINPPAAKLINKKPSELHGQIMNNIYPWERQNRHFTPELAKPGLYHYSDIVLPHGSEVYYLDLMVSVIDSKESEVKTIMTVHDLTKARELDFMKLDFVAIAAHELRTPLTVIQGYLSLLNKTGIRQLSIYNLENLQKAITGTNQLGGLINKLLSIARIERGEFELTISKLNIAKLVKEIVDQHATPAAQKQQRLSYTLPKDGHVYVPGDSASLTEVLNNLIGNAIKYTPIGGTIVVMLLVSKDEVRIEVTDNGPGIPSALRARLFTKFYRAERSLIAGTRGTGLGLYISKTIIELHHGKIGIEPDIGQGSTFFFTLPLYNEQKHAGLISNKKDAGGIRGWFKKRSTTGR